MSLGGSFFIKDNHESEEVIVSQYPSIDSHYLDKRFVVTAHAVPENRVSGGVITLKYRCFLASLPSDLPRLPAAAIATMAYAQTTVSDGVNVLI